MKCYMVLWDLTWSLFIVFLIPVEVSLLWLFFRRVGKSQVLGTSFLPTVICTALSLQSHPAVRLE